MIIKDFVDDSEKKKWRGNEKKKQQKRINNSDKIIRSLLSAADEMTIEAAWDQNRSSLLLATLDRAQTLKLYLVLA